MVAAVEMKTDLTHRKTVKKSAFQVRDDLYFCRLPLFEKSKQRMGIFHETVDTRRAPKQLGQILTVGWCCHVDFHRQIPLKLH